VTEMTTQPEPARPVRSVHERGSRLAYLLRDWRNNVIYIGFGAIFLIFAITLEDRGFLQSNNLLNIPRQAAAVTVAAVAMTFVISAAQIDLSVGSTVGFAGLSAAYGAAHGGLAMAIVCALGAGLLVGSINGFLVTVIEIPSFLVTLSMLWIVKGFGQWRTDSKPQLIESDAFGEIFGSNTMRIVWLVAFAVIGVIVLNKTRAGRFVLATGGNRTAAEFSGIPTRRVTFLVFVGMGFAAAFAGMITSGNLNNFGRAEYGVGLELSVIAAVILGGTSLFGGKGSILGAVFGGLFVQLVQNGLLLTGWNTNQVDIIKGIIILVAVALRRESRAAR
jgi:ribose transport system permease protein